MGAITADEVNFQQLLDRSERLISENISCNIPKLHAALKEMEELHDRLQRNRNIDSDVLKCYGRDLQSLRLQIGREPKRSATIKDQDLSESNAFMEAKKKAVHQADLRMQLLEGPESSSSLDLDLDTEQINKREAEKQENLVGELFGMTLSRLHQVTNTHKGNLLKESKRLEERAYRSWCDCLYVVGVCAIIMSFIAMVVVMRAFTKKSL